MTSKSPYKFWLSPAKINLFLRITGKRKNGYHKLQTIFQLLDFYDEISFSITNNGNIRRISGNKSVSCKQDLIIKAAKLLQQTTNNKQGADVSIVKRIPIGGGLGGGSSNAATTLIALNYLWNTRLSKTQLMTLGLKLGADVPMFVNGRSAWAEGIGEILDPIQTPAHYFLIVFINKPIATEKIFSHYALTISKPQGKIINFFDLKDTHNDCLQAAIKLQADIKPALTLLNECSSYIGKARMSGTGSCVFVEFLTQKDALVACKKMPKKWTSFVAQAINTSPIFNWAVAKR